MHGAGNDFILINNIREKLPTDCLPALARRLCCFHSSIGADGMIVVIPAEKGGDYGMLFYNADGSLGEMCGNGARCLARFGYENGLAGEVQRMETTAGLVIGQRLDRRHYRIRLNDPSIIDLHRSVTVDGQDYDCAYVELGCPGIPHAVLLLEDFDRWDRVDLGRLGSRLRHAGAFPKGANVSFVRLLGRDRLQAITFERGVEDFTLACGTGCGSIVTALCLRGLVSGQEVSVSMPGGELQVSLCREGDGVRDLFLSGPTCMVCRGEVLDEDLLL